MQGQSKIKKYVKENGVTTGDLVAPFFVGTNCVLIM